LENVRRVRGTDRRERFGALFTASLKNPVPPPLVAQRILQVAENGTWQLRHLVGPTFLENDAPSPQRRTE